MSELVSFLANLELYSGPSMRQTPFASGYRPVFSFGIPVKRVSGRIDLISEKLFFPGRSGIVKVTFIAKNVADIQLGPGILFNVSEGLKDMLGKGEILVEIE